MNLFFISVLVHLILCNTPKKWFGFYQDSKIGSVRAGATLHLAKSPLDATKAYELGQKSLLYTNYLLNWTGGLHLADDWQQRWVELSKQASPLLQNETIIGFDLGDELVWNCLPVVQMYEYANAVRKTFPSAIIWVNEATPVLEGRNYCGKTIDYTIPSAVTWFSIDMYHMDGPDKDFVDRNVKGYYEKYIFPELKEGQYAVTVPGSFGSNVNKKCNEKCYSELCQLDAENFVKWAVEDDRVAGIIPWHWDGPDPGCEKFKDELGTVQDEDLIAKWKELSSQLL